jgi:hypothetical protein
VVARWGSAPSVERHVAALEADHQPFHHFLQAETRDAEELGGASLVALGAAEGASDELGFERVEPSPQVEAVGARGFGTGGVPNLAAQVFELHGVIGEHERAAHLVFELAHVTRPRKRRERVGGGS